MDEVERVARLMQEEFRVWYFARNDKTAKTWSDLCEWERDAYRRVARAVIADRDRADVPLTVESR